MLLGGRIVSAAAPALRHTVRRGGRLPVVTRRWNSTSSEPSPYSAFFKTFGRPIAKVSLMSIFVYQLIFYGWTKLEQDEVRADRQDAIAKLEAQVQELQAAKKT